MRVAAWAFIVCTLLGVVGVFVPAVGLRTEVGPLARRTSLSLWQASNDKELVRRFVASYGKSTSKRYGAALIRVLGPRAHGRVKSNLDDAHDAMETLDALHEEDVATGARAFQIALWVFLGLHAVMGFLIFSNLMDGRYRTRTLVLSILASVLVSATAIGIYWVCGAAVLEANDELGIDLVTTRIGATLLPAATVGGLAALLVLAILRARLPAPEIRTRTGT